MADKREDRAVPSGRVARLGAFGRLGLGVVGGALAEGARRLAAGERPRVDEMLLTSGNLSRVADRLAHLRGAAMKLGQMVSMDAGDVLPPELSAILARLRDQAYHMPPAQLNAVLAAEWGRDWRRRFAHFEAAPIAAASIGQVHRATLPDGSQLAIKVQYPGVADSIGADVDNVATLLRLSRLLPPTLAVAPLLAEAKQQLMEEADYLREAEQMRRYAALVGDDPAYQLPEPVNALTTARVLAMRFLPGRPIEALADEPQATRDRAMTALVRLVLLELFRFGVMQTDPNFANYRWQPEGERLVLLDFGATRDVPVGTADAYRALIAAGLAGDRQPLIDRAVTAGFLGPDLLAAHRAAVERMVEAVLAAFDRPGPFDFGDRAFVPVVRAEAGPLLADKNRWHLPPTDTLFIQRKVSGTALLCARLKARVDVRRLLRDVAGLSAEA
jgi:predicted unusual protein kinase regulating ubiquinone biosynthesis (AarF/ABC1/UbiB family)